MKRDFYRLVSKQGHKYELDRSTWTKYQNFKWVVDCIEDALIKSGLEKAL